MCHFDFIFVVFIDFLFPNVWNFKRLICKRLFNLYNYKILVCQMMIFGVIVLAFFWLLYWLFELMAICIIIVLVSSLFTVIYFNQNKILYMPGKFILIKWFPICHCLLQITPTYTGIPQIMHYKRKICNWRHQTALKFEDGMLKIRILSN